MIQKPRQQREPRSPCGDAARPGIATIRCKENIKAPQATPWRRKRKRVRVWSDQECNYHRRIIEEAVERWAHPCRDREASVEQEYHMKKVTGMSGAGEAGAGVEGHG
ncbi:hypothetical protein NDU88_007095 [Pleurodeles waltl]|uniref:Uncharacterized protein n=1 Tax=Pleurodeles waltl TaxID=8319 RepID=A0AAV7UMX0_PLEWA|nr:hypothetical protein NDU88_007095 [Pleurodeles waltl]